MVLSYGTYDDLRSIDIGSGASNACRHHMYPTHKYKNLHDQQLTNAFILYTEGVLLRIIALFRKPLWNTP